MVNEIVSWEPIEKNLGADWAEIDSLVVLGGIYSVEGDAFHYIRKCCVDGRLSGVNLSKSTVAVIPPSAFALSSSDIESGKTSHLRHVSLTPGLREIGNGAFEGTGLQSVSLPRTVEKIGSRAFASCTRLRSVTLRGNRAPASVAPDAFSGSSDNAVLNVFSGAAVSYGTSEVWSRFKAVSTSDDLYREMSVHLDGTRTAEEILGNGSLHVDSLTLSGIPTDEDLRYLFRLTFEDGGSLYGIDMRDCDISVLDKTSLGGSENRVEYLRLPKNLKKIGPSCFSSSYIGWIELPDGLEEICGDAFWKCRHLDMDLVIPEGVRKIGENAFYGCSALRSVHLPSTLSEIGYDSFFLSLLYNGHDVYMNRKYPPVTTYYGLSDGEAEKSYGPFEFLDGTDGHGWRLFVPLGARAAYEAHPHWKHFGEIVETAGLTGGPNAVEGVTVPDNGNGVSEVYTLSGRLVWRGSGTPSLQKGLYIMKENGRAVKRIVE